MHFPSGPNFSKIRMQSIVLYCFCHISYPQCCVLIDFSLAQNCALIGTQLCNEWYIMFQTFNNNYDRAKQDYLDILDLVQFDVSCYLLGWQDTNWKCLVLSPFSRYSFVKSWSCLVYKQSTWKSIPHLDILEQILVNKCNFVF